MPSEGRKKDLPASWPQHSLSSGNNVLQWGGEKSKRHHDTIYCVNLRKYCADTERGTKAHLPVLYVGRSSETSSASLFYKGCFSRCCTWGKSARFQQVYTPTCSYAFNAHLLTQPAEQHMLMLYQTGKSAQGNSYACMEFTLICRCSNTKRGLRCANQCRDQSILVSGQGKGLVPRQVQASQLAALAFATVKGVYRQNSLTANSMIPWRMPKRFTELAENNVPVSPTQLTCVFSFPPIFTFTLQTTGLQVTMTPAA